MEDEIIKNKIIEITQNVLQKAGFEGKIKLIDNILNHDNFPIISIESENDLSILIGRNGQNLNALEHIVKLITFRQLGNQNDFQNKSFIIDINDYRKSRTKYILDIAQTAAQRVISSQQSEALLPMSPYERRLVHTELASYKEIQTESIGEEPRRRVVIKPIIL